MTTNQIPAADLVRDNTRLRVLAEVSHAFAAVATDYQKLIDKIARTAADLVGDACMVTLLDIDGESLVNAASAHRDYKLESDYKTYLAGLRVPLRTSNSVSALVIRTGVPQMADVDPAAMVSQADVKLQPIVARLNVHSYAVIPIHARGTTIGTLSLLRSRPNQSYTADDATLLQDLADRAGLAIENARLYNDLEIRVKLRTSELESLNKDLESFSHSVAHDLRAPLRTIDGLSQGLLDSYSKQLDADGQFQLKRIRDSSKRINKLVDGILVLSKVSRTERLHERVDLSQLAEAVVTRLKESQPERKVEFVIEPDLVANGDSRLLDVVLTNLLGNAFKFTGRHALGRIEFAGKRSESVPVVYFVRDNGAGFDPTFAEKLFKAFERLHKESDFEGTGIGLATVQRIVLRHGGKIWAEAEENKGATFYFTLAD